MTLTKERTLEWKQSQGTQLPQPSSTQRDVPVAETAWTLELKLYLPKTPFR